LGEIKISLKFMYKIINNQNGSAIFLVILVLAGILTATIGINNLVLKGIKFSRNIFWSAPAYFAAETGMEKALNQIRKVDSKNIPAEGSMNGNFGIEEAKWEVGFKCKTPEEDPYDCAGKIITGEGAEILDDTTLTIKSTGSYKDVHRSIALSFCIKGDCK
jgi:hypothetical protein